ncbi:MAG: GNAT family N-acetyltransferase [Chitinophagaceae bacterium]|nr:GNAT family N-acetyltransferase [Chitinophagaceae bacterium]
MFIIKSDRLSLWALSYEQVIALSNNRNNLEKSIGLFLSTFELNADENFLNELAEALNSHIAPMIKKNVAFYEWYTHWLIVDEQQKLTIGGIGGTGLPDANGEVMIGYFIDKKFEKQGYATEALNSFVKWLFQNNDLLAVIADTPVDNFGSQRVLQKAGFKRIGEVEEVIKWKLSR